MLIQKDIKLWNLINFQNKIKNRLLYVILQHEKGIISNRESFHPGELISQIGTNHSSGAEKGMCSKFGLSKIS